MQRRQVLTQDNLERLVELSENPNWEVAKIYLDVQKHNLSEQLLLCRGEGAAECVAELRGTRVGLQRFYNYIDKKAEEELEKRRKKNAVQKQKTT